MIDRREGNDRYKKSYWNSGEVTARTAVRISADVLTEGYAVSFLNTSTYCIG